MKWIKSLRSCSNQDNWDNFSGDYFLVKRRKIRVGYLENIQYVKPSVKRGAKVENLFGTLNFFLEKRPPQYSAHFFTFAAAFKK